MSYQTFRAGRSPCLDLPTAQTDNDVGDGDVLCFSRAVRHHNTYVLSADHPGRLKDGLMAKQLKIHVENSDT